ncbi:MAG TPA: FMN-binding protein [Nitrospiraceae bacterium]|nr:FMN-binding protein [Nitrospiraceae bacterium]
MYRVMTVITPMLCVFMLSLGWAVPATAERVWDAELKRYLTPQEMGQEDVFMSELEAARLIFPKSERIGEENVRLSSDQKKIIEDRIGWHFPEDEFTVFIGKTDTEIDGYAIVQNTIGKHKAITYMVGVDNKGEVLGLEVLVYREAKGSEVRTKRFNAQYEGKTIFDPIRINRDIINISGATMSVRSLSAGVKRTLVMVDELYFKPAGRGSDTVTVKRSQQGVLGRLFGGLLGN